MILELAIEYFNWTTTEFSSSLLSTSNELIITFGKYVSNFKLTFSFNPSSEFSEIYWSKKDLKPPPKVGFNGLSPGLVKK